MKRHRVAVEDLQYTNQGYVADTVVGNFPGREQRVSHAYGRDATAAGLPVWLERQQLLHGHLRRPGMYHTNPLYPWETLSVSSHENYMGPSHMHQVDRRNRGVIGPGGYMGHAFDGDTRAGQGLGEQLNEAVPVVVDEMNMRHFGRGASNQRLIGQPVESRMQFRRPPPLNIPPTQYFPGAGVFTVDAQGHPNVPAEYEE